MKLPNGDRALIDPRKITHYCLSPEHDDGKHKARVFQDLLGLTLNDADLLLDALERAAIDGDAVLGKQDKYGQRYVIDFDFAGPKGNAIVRSAWIVRAGESVPRLVSCYIL
jgi:hypothetical protein